jgi:hypothetical protein
MDTSLVNPTPIVCHLEEKELIFDLTVPKKFHKTPEISQKFVGYHFKSLQLFFGGNLT